MTHYLEYRLGPTDDGKEVLFLMQKVLGFTTKKVRSVKHEEWGILLNGKKKVFQTYVSYIAGTWQIFGKYIRSEREIQERL